MRSLISRAGPAESRDLSIGCGCRDEVWPAAECFPHVCCAWGRVASPGGTSKRRPRPEGLTMSACSNKVSHFGAGCSLKVTRGVGRGLQWAGHNGLARDEVAACVASVAVLVNP